MEDMKEIIDGLYRMEREYPKYQEFATIALALLLFKGHITEEEIQESSRLGINGLIDLLKKKYDEFTPEDEARILAQARQKQT